MNVPRDPLVYDTISGMLEALQACFGLLKERGEEIDGRLEKIERRLDKIERAR